jgi:hypothetical protein
MHEGDRNFILKTWKSGLKRSHQYRDLEPGAFWRWANEHVGKILDDENSTTLVAVSPEDTEYILGWACGRPSPHTIHYVYVKDTYRRNRLGLHLVEAVIGKPFGHIAIYATHWTPVCEILAAADPIVYAPSFTNKRKTP